MSETNTSDCPHLDLLESSDSDSIECQNCGRGPVDLVIDLEAQLLQANERADMERNTRLRAEGRAAKAEAELAERPTAWAYQQACRVLEKHRQRADAAEQRARDAVDGAQYALDGLRSILEEHDLDGAFDLAEALHGLGNVLAVTIERARATLPAGRGEPEPMLPNPEGAGASPEVLSDLLSLVTEPWPSPAVIATWSAEDRALAEEWAAAVHLRASDHYDVEVPEMPVVLTRWAGGEP